MSNTTATAGANQRAPDDAIVRAEGVTVRFDGQAVLRDLSLDVRRGETLVVIGESGCGKTVLLKTLIGLITPSRGRVLLDGEPLSAMGERRLAEARTRYGFVFQQAALFDSATIAENVTFPIVEHRRASREAALEMAADRLRQVGLPTSVMGKKPAELSGGMRKRVGLARALMTDPDVLLYDEPTTGLDPIMSDVVNELILRTRERRAAAGTPVTSVVVTHDMHSARKVADRIVMLHPVARLGGSATQVLYDGDPGEIDSSRDARVTQFVRGEARDRIEELAGA